MKLLTGRMLTVEVEPSDTVESLKDKIKDSTGIDVRANRVLLLLATPAAV